jgi:uncharacterized membrane protein YgdD (TMEM256/DUF423 family)
VSQTFFVLGGLLGALAVAAGAFGGHLLKERLSTELLAIFEVAVRYHMYHALALLGAGWAAIQWPGPWTTAAGYCFAVGIVFFSGSLYVLSLSGVRWLGAITPLGGLAFIAGWLCLVAAAWKS